MTVDNSNLISTEGVWKKPENISCVTSTEEWPEPSASTVKDPSPKSLKKDKPKSFVTINSGSGNSSDKSRSPKGPENAKSYSKENNRQLNYENHRGYNENYKNNTHNSHKYYNENYRPLQRRYNNEYSRPYRKNHTDEYLKNNIKFQAEYYFSVENLIKDVYFRLQMNEEGWVNIAVIGSFNRMKMLTTDLELIKESLQGSQVVELQSELVRLRDNWKIWVYPEGWRTWGIDRPK